MSRPQPNLPDPGRRPKPIGGARRRWALVTSVAAVMIALGCFACWVVAIWNPWGHAQQWGSMGAACLFPVVILGFTSAILWTGGES